MKFIKNIVKKNSFLIAMISLVMSIILVIGFFSYILSDTNAKYVNNESFDNYLETNHFYFSSDVLGETLVTKTINQYNYDEIPFNIYNYDAGKVSSNDVDYDISCSVNNANYSCKVDTLNTNSTSGTLVSSASCYNGSEVVDLTESECYTSGYRYLYNSASDAHYIIVSKTNSSDNSSMIEVTLSATSTSPFAKTLSALYKLRLATSNDNDIIVNLLSSNTSTCKYTIENNYNSDRRVKLTLNNNNLLFDLTGEFYKNKLSSSLSSDGYIESLKVNLVPYKTYTFELYKKDFTHTCSVSDVEIDEIDEVNSKCNFTGSLVQGATYSDGVYTYSYKQQRGSSSWNNISSDGWGFMLTDNTATEVNVSPCTSLGGKNVISASYAFFNANNLSYIDLTDFDTSNIINMNSMFYRTGYNSSVTNFKLIGLEFWDTSNVTNMSSMFYYTGYYSSTFNLNLKNFNTSKVSSLSSMFRYAGYSATSVDIGDLSNFSTIKVTNMSYMFDHAFYNASEFNLNLSGWTTIKATNMNHMFNESWHSADDFVLDISGWNTSLVTNMSYMFNNAINIKKIYVGKNFSTTAVTDSTSMFNGASVLVGQNGTALNASYLDKTYAVIDGGSSSPGYLSSHYIDKRSKCAYTGTPTQGTSFSDGTYTYKYMQKKGATSWENMTTDGWGVVLTNSSATTVSESPCFSIGDKPVVSLSYTYAGILYATSIDLTNFESENIIDMNSTFYQTGCNSGVTNFIILGLDDFNTKNVTNMSYTFYKTGYYATTSILGNLNNWDTSSVTNMSYMFAYSNYNSTDYIIGSISKWDVSHVLSMSNMFSNAGYNSAVFEIGELDDWNTSLVTNMDYIFSNAGYSAVSFVIGDLSNWNVTNVTSKTNAFLNAGSNYGYTAPSWSS